MNKEDAELTVQMLDTIGDDAIIQIAEIGDCMTISKKNDPELWALVIKTVRDYADKKRN